MKQVVVTRGVVEVNISDAPPGSGGGTSNSGGFDVGERVTLPADEVVRLARSGAVKVVS